MTSRFSIRELSEMTLSNPFKFSKGLKLLKVKPKVSENNEPLEVQGMTFEDIGSQLFDVSIDKEQKFPIDDPEVIKFLLEEMVKLMKQADAPKALFERLNLKCN